MNVTLLDSGMLSTKAKLFRATARRDQSYTCFNQAHIRFIGKYDPCRMQADFTSTTKSITEGSSYNWERTILQSHACSLRHADCLIQECPFVVPGSIQYKEQVCSGGEMFAPIPDYKGVKMGSPLFACEQEYFAYFIGQGICLGVKLHQSDAIADIDNAGSHIFPKNFSLKL